MRKYLLFITLLLGSGIGTKAQKISIQTEGIQLVLSVKPDGRLYQVYLGERLLEGTPLENLDMPLSGLSSASVKGDEVYPVMGTEDYFEPAFEIRHADGTPTSILKYVSHTVRDNETVITLRDELYPLTVTLHYVVYPKEDIIRQWTEISHQEKGMVSIGRYASSMLYFEAPAYYLTEFSGDWAREMQMNTVQLNYGKKIVDTRLGSRAAMFSQPFFEVGLGAPVQENQGTVLMGTIGWTGNFRFTFEVDNQQQLRIVSGINPDASAYTLKRNEIFRTPDFYFTLSQTGSGPGSRHFQQWALSHQLYQGHEDRHTLLNNWENTGFDFNETKLDSLFVEASNLGVDLFLLDDGWFGNKYPRMNDHAGLGDWQPTASKLPNGIHYLVKHANEAGVDFGIWIEPEMVNPKSELAERHPDWILRLPNREVYYFRNQLVLDLANPAVQDHVFGVVDGLMQENPQLKFMKWDCNSPITNIYSPYLKACQGNLYIDYVRGLYKVLERIHGKYPDLYMMMCSGGGGRSDFEGLRYFTEFWCSDNTDPVDRLFIQWGYSQFMPAKAMCSHVTNWNTDTSVKFRVDVCFPYKFGFDIDLNSMSDADRQYCKQAINLYNSLKPVIYSPLLYRLYSPYEGQHCAFMRVSEDQSHALLFAYDIHPRYNRCHLPVRLQGLDAVSHYQVREISLMPGETSKLPDNGNVYTGDYLMKVGLKVFAKKHCVSHIIEIVKTK